MTGADLPEITEVQRVTIRPGDRVVVRLAVQVDDATTDKVAEMVARYLTISRRRVLVLGPNVSVEVMRAEGTEHG